MFKTKCKCLNCKHLADGIYLQKNECYNRIKLQISQAMDTAIELDESELYIWLKGLRKNLETFQKYYE